MAQPTYPIVNDPNLYVQGLRLAYATATTMTVALGQARNSTNQNDIVLSAGVTINAAATGANGLDTGSLANNTLYAVHVIADSNSYYATACMLSTSATAPVLPFGYNMFRRIGWVLTDGSAHILAFTQSVDSNGTNRQMYYDAAISVLSGGSSATFTAQSLAACVPAQATVVGFSATVTPTAAADKAALRPTGSSSTNGYEILSGAVAGVAQTATMVCPTNATPSIDYKVTGTLTLLVTSYVDQL